VAGEECSDEAGDAVYTVMLPFAVVMQMDLDVGDGIRRHALERFHEPGPILFFGIEEGITGRLAG
jgi:hypothetical protein